MTAAHAKRLPPPVSAASSDWSVLTRIFDDQVNLAILQRKLNEQIIIFAQSLRDQACGMNLRVTLTSVAAVESVMPEKYQSLPGHDAFIADLRELVEAYWLLFTPKAVGLRLHVLDYAMCPRFHTDHVPVRLITSYEGVGTCWLEESDVQRRLLGKTLSGRPDPHEEAGSIQSLKAGDVGLFKGDAWIGNEGRGVVHRSPACGQEGARVVVTLDWVAD